MASDLIKRLKKEKKLSELIINEKMEDTYLSTNCISVNLLLSGKIKGGIKRGKISTICADSGWGKSMIGLNVLKAAYQQGMDCIVIDTEHAFNRELAVKLGINLNDIAIFETSVIPDIKKIYSNVNSGLTRQESLNTFFLFDSWGPIVEQQVLDKAEEGSSAVNMSSAKFKNELANIINSYGNTNLVLNHVYDTMTMYGDKFAVPGGKRLFFNSDAIVLASSAAKAKNKTGDIVGKIITAGVKKGRAAKEFVKTKFLIDHNGGINPYFGLLQEAMDCGLVIKPKPGAFTRPDYDKDGKIWKETELYCAKFWVDLYKDQTFNNLVERKFAFEDSVLISATQDVLSMIDGHSEIPEFESKLLTNKDIEDEEADEIEEA